MSKQVVIRISSCVEYISGISMQIMPGTFVITLHFIGDTALVMTICPRQ